MIFWNRGVEASGLKRNKMVWNQRTQQSLLSNERNEVTNAPHCLIRIICTNWNTNPYTLLSFRL